MQKNFKASILKSLLEIPGSVLSETELIDVEMVCEDKTKTLDGTVA